MLKDDGDMRMLGTRDGLIHALIDVQDEIGRLAGPYTKINPRHTRKIAERDRILAPLRRLEARIEKQMRDCRDAYEQTRKPVSA